MNPETKASGLYQGGNQYFLQRQQQSRSRIKQQKFWFTSLGYLIVLSFFAILQFIGIILFTQGFLLSRQVLPQVSSCNGSDICSEGAKFDKLVFLVIDALRFDFTIDVEGSDKHYHNNFPILHKLSQEEPDNALLLKFISDPPTTTLQRLKGLTTGTLPTFIDAGSNFNGDAIDEDNWILQLHNNNKSVAFMGDDTWMALFEKYFNPQLSFPYDSLNVLDTETVDNGVILHLFPLLDSENSTKWDVLIGHFLGVDHIGHSYNPNHFMMKKKLEQMNQVITDVTKKIDDKTLLVVIGDHGMDATGNHGGDSKDEVETSLFMYSKQKRFKFHKKNKSFYDTSELGKKYRSVNQIDLVPTISLLLGLPIPFNNLGYPIDEAFEDDKKLSAASYKTIRQIEEFRLASGLTDDEAVNSKFADFTTFFSTMKKSKKDEAKAIELAKNYQISSLEHCKSMWARFDLNLISVGIIILSLSLTLLMTYSRSIPSVRVLTMSFEFIGSIVAMILLGLVLSFSVFFVFRPHIALNKCLSVGVAFGITIGFWAPIMDRFSVDWICQQTKDFFIYNFNFWSFLGMSFAVLHALVFASNSYVVWEDKMILFFVLTFGFSCFFLCITNIHQLKYKKIMGILHSITFIILSRLVSMINVCREEQHPYCKVTFRMTWWSVLLLYVIAIIIPLIISSFYKLTNSYYSAAPIWIGKGVRYMLLLNAIYWTIEFIGNHDKFLASSWVSISPILKSLKLGIARVVLGITLVVTNFGWLKGPLCISIGATNNVDNRKSGVNDNNSSSSGNSASSIILGYGNIYGSSYFLLVLNFAVSAIFVSKPLGAISLSILLVQILTLLELIDMLDLRRNLVSSIMLCILGYQHFFSTGHQATIPSIQWETGFMTTETIVFPFTHVNIILNTFGSFIIVGLAVPLITLWRIKPSGKSITVLSQIITNITTLLTYQTLTSLSSFIFAAHFRRHLMVWKIFAPRFMLSGLLLIVFNLHLIFCTFWFGSGRILNQVNRIFGK